MIQVKENNTVKVHYTGKFLTDRYLIRQKEKSLCIYLGQGSLIPI
jgi:FKBP-type peptidyl-prolyl cis-trans isomerase 2